MADAAIGVVTEAVLKTVIPLVAEEVSLAWGVKKEVGNVADKVEMIRALLSGAQGKQITIPAVQLWLKKLQSISLDAQIVLEEFSYQVICKKIECRKRDKVRSCFSCSNAVFLRLKMAHKIKDILSSLDKLYTEASRIGVQPVELINSLPDLKENRLSTVPYVEDSKFVGREDDVAKVIAMLTKSYHEHERELPVVTILGMGGQGKTALAQMVYKSDMVKSYFDKRIWVCVSDNFDVKRLLAEMASTQVNYQSVSTVELVSILKRTLESSKYLLVLDDVWNDDVEEWEHMRSCLLEVGGSSGSKILATTRSDDVALAMRSKEYHRLGILTNEQSWELFEKCAFADGGPTKTPQLVDIGGRVLKRCGGVPLAIKTIGGTLYSKKSESDWLLIERSEMWSTYNGGDKVVTAIKLSYDHLPSLLVKQCFAYCAIFEKDTEMDKDGVIQLWMAQGFLNVPKGSHLQMEDLGDIYYNILLRSSLLQDATKVYDVTKRCRMHDLVHDVSLQISENHCLHIEDSKTIKNRVEAVHISVTLRAIGEWRSLKGFLPPDLRTLYLKTPDLSKDMFQDLECVVALTIENKSAEELPISIGKMKLLRFLDVGKSRITKLPESLTKLYLLQSLRVDYLTEVPKRFGNLINLRHIYFFPDDFELEPNKGECLFKGLGNLKNLETLPYFRVGRSEDGCHIEELEHLNNLRGTLKIFGLQNVGSYESAIKSNLPKKSNVQTLELQWDDEREGESWQLDRDDVAEGLKPCSTVKSLTIKGFQSRKCPSWVKKENLANLVELRLEKLNSCEKLPPLGDLPFLEELYLEQLPNLRCIGPEFYGSEMIVFPVLKKLSIGGMESLMEWSDAIRSVPPSSERVRVFPCIEEMRIEHLTKLCVFPNLGPLPNLRQLVVYGCKASCSSEVLGSEIELFSSLRHLHMLNCAEMTAPLCSLIQHSAPLKELEIGCNPESWPKDLHHLSSLESLIIGGAFDGDVYEDDCLPWPYPYPSTHCTSLTSLWLLGDGLPRITILPSQIQYLTKLTEFRISNFDRLECIPEWLGNLECLRVLILYRCKNLNRLPSVEAFNRLTNLRDLAIILCPLLNEQYKEGRNWPPNLDVRINN